METTGVCAAAVHVSLRDGDATVEMTTDDTGPTEAVRPPPPPTDVVLVLTLWVVVPTAVLRADGAATVVTLSRPAVVVAAAAVPTTAAVVEVAADAEAIEDVEVPADAFVHLTADVAAAAAAAADDASREATTDGDTSVSSGGLGGGVAKLDQHVDGELLLDATLLAQSRPTSTSTRVDHVVSQGDSERVGEDDTIGSSFK